MYFAVIGDKKELTLKELEQLGGIKYLNKNIITFEYDNTDKLSEFGSIIKWGKVVNHQDFDTYFSGIRLLGCNKKEFAIKLKKQYKIKRFKITTVINTDREVKQKGTELIKIENFYGVVLGYQNIPLYEKIDFGKPARSMQMGMMPSKLNHIMLNLGLQAYKQKNTKNENQNICIYDPFVGSGTTCFLANYFGYESVGSDLKTQYFANNLERWKQQKEFNQSKRIHILNHDIKTDYTTQEKEKYFQDKEIIIVTEGWLGPIVKANTDNKSIKKYQKQVEEVYSSFLVRIAENFGTISMIFTIPYYMKHENIHNTLAYEIKETSEGLGRNYQDIDEVYARERQYIGRKIIILS